MAARAVVLAFIGLQAGTVHAQPIDKDSDAERFFREGQALMAERRYGEACPKFQDAYKKDQQLGTLLNLAYCHKEQGSTWQAWLEFKEAEVKATELKRADRITFARQRMAELEKSSSLARVMIDVPSKDKAELTEILVEDRRVWDAEKGATFAAEPGQRKFTFRAKGKKQVVQLVPIHSKTAAAQHIAVPEMEEQPKEPIAVEPVSVSEDPKPVPRTKDAPAAEPSSGGAWRTVMFIAFGVGIPVLAVGAVTGVMTLTSDCAGQRDLCSNDKYDQARTTGVVADITIPIGSVGVAAGLAILLFGPSSKSSAAASRSPHGIRATPQLGAGWAGVRGTF